MRRAGAGSAGSGGGGAPEAHATTHKSGGTDAVKLDELAAPTDVTTLNASTSAHGLLPKLPAASSAPGLYLSALGTWTQPVASPRTLYDYDLTAVTTGAISDGSVLIDGKTWTAGSSANASVIALTNGSGLVITAASGTSRTFTGAAKTAPWITVPLASLGVTDLSVPITVWLYFPSWSTPSSSNAVIAGLYAAASGSYTDIIGACGFIHDGSTQRPLQQRTATLNNVAPLGSGYNVVAVRLLPGGVVEGWVGSWSSGWPAMSAMTLAFIDQQVGASTVASLALLQRTGLSLLLAAATRSVTGSPSLTLARVRVTSG